MTRSHSFASVPALAEDGRWVYLKVSLEDVKKIDRFGPLRWDQARADAFFERTGDFLGPVLGKLPLVEPGRGVTYLPDLRL